MQSAESSGLGSTANYNKADPSGISSIRNQAGGESPLGAIERNLPPANLLRDPLRFHSGENSPKRGMSYIFNDATTRVRGADKQTHRDAMDLIRGTGHEATSDISIHVDAEGQINQISAQTQDGKLTISRSSILGFNTGLTVHNSANWLSSFAGQTTTGKFDRLQAALSRKQKSKEKAKNSDKQKSKNQEEKRTKKSIVGRERGHAANAESQEEESDKQSENSKNDNSQANDRARRSVRHSIRKSSWCSQGTEPGSYAVYDIYDSANNNICTIHVIRDGVGDVFVSKTTSHSASHAAECDGLYGNHGTYENLLQDLVDIGLIDMPQRTCTTTPAPDTTASAQATTASQSSAGESSSSDIGGIIGGVIGGTLFVGAAAIYAYVKSIRDKYRISDQDTEIVRHHKRDAQDIVQQIARAEGRGDADKVFDLRLEISRIDQQISNAQLAAESDSHNRAGLAKNFNATEKRGQSYRGTEETRNKQTSRTKTSHSHRPVRSQMLTLVDLDAISLHHQRAQASTPKGRAAECNKPQPRQSGETGQVRDSNLGHNQLPSKTRQDEGIWMMRFGDLAQRDKPQSRKSCETWPSPR